MKNVFLEEEILKRNRPNLRPHRRATKMIQPWGINYLNGRVICGRLDRKKGVCSFGQERLFYRHIHGEAVNARNNHYKN